MDSKQRPQMYLPSSLLLLGVPSLLIMEPPFSGYFSPNERASQAPAVGVEAEAGTR